jgi:hypothetical protein
MDETLVLRGSEQLRIDTSGELLAVVGQEFELQFGRLPRMMNDSSIALSNRK